MEQRQSDALSRAVEDLTTEELQAVFASLVSEYSGRVQRLVDNGDDPFPPLGPDDSATATDVMVTARNMLKVFEIAPFELNMLRY